MTTNYAALGKLAEGPGITWSAEAYIVPAVSSASRISASILELDLG
jgi:hypothetical protein